MTSFADIAPRLARAHAAYVVALRREDTERLELLGEVVRAEALVAHRDLQLARAGSTRRAARNAVYMAERHLKLKDAEAWLARLRSRLVHLSDWRTL